MKELTSLFLKAGCEDVRTYIQSGNVVFRAAEKLALRLPDTIPDQVLDRFGFQPRVVLRTADQLGRIVHSNPFLKAGKDAGILHVVFFAHAPDPRFCKGIDRDRFLPDEFIVQGEEVFLCLPDGVARSKLAAVNFAGSAEAVATMRNWRTVTTLLAMTGHSSGLAK
jgi:uncharacterized protein (DUF1697 family)